MRITLSNGTGHQVTYDDIGYCAKHHGGAPWVAQTQKEAEYLSAYLLVAGHDIPIHYVGSNPCLVYWLVFLEGIDLDL